MTAPTTTRAETLANRMSEGEAALLTTTLADLAASGVLPAAAAQIAGARRRYVAGSGKSLAYATLLASDLAVACSHVHLIDDATVPALDVLAEVAPSDVLVAYSFSRYRRATVALADAFAGAGGTVVAVTDGPDSPLAPVAETVIEVGTDAGSFVESPTGVVAASHILATLVGASAKGARRRIAARDSLAADLGLYLADGEHAVPEGEL